MKLISIEMYDGHILLAMLIYVKHSFRITHAITINLFTDYISRYFIFKNMTTKKGLDSYVVCAIPKSTYAS